MPKRNWKISLRHFMILGAVTPPMVALGAGHFGRLPAIVFWIWLISIFWFGTGCLIVLGIVRLGKRVLAGVEWLQPTHDNVADGGSAIEIRRGM